MDILQEDLLRFWKCLQECNVKYIMIGGVATRFHGFNRSTEDLDIWIDDTIPNRQNLRNAFIAFGYGDVPLLETMQFIPGWTSFHIAQGIELDILTSMKGLENISFAESLSQASVADIDGIKVPFLHINHLILNKMTINRPKDQVDVIELEKIKKIREGR